MIAFAKGYNKTDIKRRGNRKSDTVAVVTAPTVNQESTAPVIQNYYTAPPAAPAPPATMTPPWGMQSGYANNPYIRYGYMQPPAQPSLPPPNPVQNTETRSALNVPRPAASSPIQPSITGYNIMAAFASHVLRTEFQPARINAITIAFTLISKEFLRLEDLRGQAGEKCLVRLGIKSGITKLISREVLSFKTTFKNKQVARNLLKLANRAPFGGSRSSRVTS